MTTHRITHKIILRARLDLISPLRIGNGDGAYTQLAILRDAEGQAYLPGSSLAGVLRARWLDEVDLSEDNPLRNAARAFWGTTAVEDTKRPQSSSQSHFFVADMPIVGEHPRAVVRDGVRIKPETGTVDGDGKYDYELLEPGARFEFKAEVTVRAGIDAHEVLRIVHWIMTAMQRDLQVGGNTTKGFGRLDCKDFQCWHLDFTTKDPVPHADAWIAYCEQNQLPDSAASVNWANMNLNPLSIKPSAWVQLTATFSLRSSLMIGGEGSTAMDTDKAHLTAAGKPIISGKSLVGAMRQRAMRIIRTLDLPEEQIRDLFGPLGERDANGKPIPLKRSRLYADEAILSHAGQHHKQTRIRVDRFTAAPVDGGLFDSAPLWRLQDGRFTLNWRIRHPQPWDIALLLHLLRDLWTGDLPIGGEKNVGRGVLVGHSATLNLSESQQVTFSDQEGRLAIKGAEFLAPYNKPLSSLIPTTNPSLI